MSFFKQRQPAEEEYRQEFRRLAKAMWELHSIPATSFYNLLEAMASVENELNNNGGGNWDQGEYGEYLSTIESCFSSGRDFSAAQIDKIKSSIKTIKECGKELEEEGQSSVDVSGTLDYLTARTGEWCMKHADQEDSDS